MSCYRRLLCACVAAVALLAVPSHVQGQTIRESPEGPLDTVWDWILDQLVPGDRPECLRGEEGWGMDPNGVTRAALPPGPADDGL